MIDLIVAHPYLDRSRANRALLEAVRDLPGVGVRRLYDLYPEFAIDVEAEQAALLGADVVVWQHPLYWYSVPPLLKLWFDKVLAQGWAFGKGGTKLHGKRCLWVVTTGGDQDAYGPEGMHQHPFGAFVAPIEQTARFCGMQWLAPLVLLGARHASEAHLADTARTYRALLRRLGELPEES